MTLTQTAIVTVITRQNSNSSITFSEQSETSKKVTNRRQNQYLKLTEMYTCQFDTIQPKSMLTFNLWFWPFERTDLSWVMSFLPTKKVRCSSWSFNILEKKKCLLRKHYSDRLSERFLQTVLHDDFTLYSYTHKYFLVDTFIFRVI